MFRLILFFAAYCCASTAHSKTIFVNKAAQGQNNGTSWANAYQELSVALPTAQYGDEIWVAKGTYSAYIPDQSVSFVLISGVKLFGGFAGIEAHADQRDWAVNITTLTGIGPFPFPVPNNVVYCEGTDSTTLVDGFTIRDGVAVHTIGVTSCEDTPDERICHGGGLFVYSGDPANPTFLTVRNCRFTDNIAEVGGGIAVNFWTGSGGLRVERCRFDSNIAQVYGCSIFIGTGFGPQHDITIDDCVFENHYAYYNSPVATIINLNHFSAPRIFNSTFRNNFTTLSGTCIYTENYGKAKPRYERCKFVENKAGDTWLNPGRGGVLLGRQFDVRDCYFLKNRANSGGAIAGSGLEIIGCIFDCNYAGREGGALWISRKNKILHNLFINNYSAEDGGAISNADSSQDSISNCIFIGNRAEISGNWMSSTFGNICVDYTYIDASNCEALKEGLHPLYDTLTCGPHLYFLSTDPMLRDTAAGDYRLSGCSPLLNKGDSTWAERLGLLTDFDGNPRILDGLPDIGPYETRAFRAEAAAQAIRCYGETNGRAFALPIGGFPPYSYTWGGGQQDSLLKSLSPGIYTLAMHDGDSCSDTTSIEISQPDSLYFTAIVQNATNLQMPNGSILLDTVVGGTSPYEYLWNTGGETPSLSNLAPGSYALTVTDKQGCTSVGYFEVKFMVGIEQAKQVSLRLSPNPSSGLLQLDISDPGTLSLFDAQGRLVQSQAEVQPGGAALRLEHLAPGLYRVQVETERGIFWGKWVKM